MSNQHLTVNELFYSIQGESTRAGAPCVFVRLTGCHLRCRYCDTAYAFDEGRRWLIEDLVETVCGYRCPLTEITGGEPLLQPNVHQLMASLCDRGKTVLLETSGACDISTCDSRVIRIVDLKTPGSGHADQIHWPNLDHLRLDDEIKMVICDRQDYEWARDQIAQQCLDERVGTVLLSAVAAVEPNDQIAGVTGMSLGDLARWILHDQLPVRLQTQLHKLIWDPMTRGV